MSRAVFLTLLLMGSAASLQAQRFPRDWSDGEGWLPENAAVHTAREVPTHSADIPTWTNAAGFEADVFTFVRIRYHRNPRGPRSAGYCFTDFPDSDLNLSYRLQEMTALRVDPNGRVLSLTEAELFDYPWIYMVEPGAIEFDDDEIAALRRYLQAGGFLMADDFWGPRQWENFEQQIKRVFPDRDFVELPMNHPIFHCVFDLRVAKNDLQVPGYHVGRFSESTGVTWEVHDGVECRDLHIRALLDDKGRVMILACHNTDYGDGWEREQESPYYFRHFSEQRAYPVAINSIFYAMTH